VAKLTDKEVQRFFDDVNKSPGGVKSTEPAFQRYRKQFLRDVDFKELKKYSPEQLIRGARTSEELIILGEYLHEQWGGDHWWWQEYHQRRVHLSHLPSFYGTYLDTATGKQRGMWGVPVDPQTYVRSSQSGAQRYEVNRRLFSRFANWEQITGQEQLFSVIDTPSGPSLKGWKRVKPPKLPSNMPANALIFDLETTGLLGRNNLSIISSAVSDTATGKLTPTYAAFDKSLKYDEKIISTIIPQWERAAKDKIVSERELVEGFISKIERSNKSHALMGYNIKQFDLPIMFSSAKKYGLHKRFEEAVKKSTIVDIADYAKAFISSRAGGRLIGWEQSELGINALGWQLENVAELLGYKSRGLAHEVKTDVEMTEFVWNKLKDPSKWDEYKFDIESLIEKTAKQRGAYQKLITKDMGKFNFAPQMLANESKYTTNFLEHLAETYPGSKASKATAKLKSKAANKFGLGNIASYSASFVGLNMIIPGNFWQNAFSSVTWEAARIGAKKAGVKGWKTWLAAVGGSAIGNAIWMGASALSEGPSDVAVNESGFSGRDDPYNVIQGLGESGLAPQERHDLTEFGSGWQGSRDLPSSLMGVPIDPRVLAFRRDVIEDKSELADLEADIKEKQAEAQAKLGDFEPFELGPISGPVAGLARNKNLKEVSLSDYKLTVEDADTIFLSRKGLAGLFSKDVAVRLSGIDAPEVAGHADDPMEDVRIWQEQAGGRWATEQYKKLVEEQDNLRLIIDADNKTYGRRLGVLVGDEGTNLALESVRRGLVAALPFGKSSEDVVSRRAIAQAEAEAKQNEAGIWQFARYKAISEATKQVGQPITFNVLTELTKVGRNLNLGAYGSFLESFGTQQRELTPQETYTASRIGRALKKTHGKARFSKKFSGKDDSHNTVEGLRHDGGLSEEVRKDLTQFGSGFDIFKPILQYESIEGGKSRFFTNKKKRYAVDKKSRFSGRDDEYNTIEALLHTGMARDIRQSLTEFGSGWDPVRAMAKQLFKKSKDPMEELRKMPEFKKALLEATEKTVIGEGMFGKATLMESAFMGEKFQFVRKTGEIGKQEVAAMRAAEESIAPSIYSHAEDTIDMELFKGTPLQSLTPEKARELEPEVAKAFGKLHSAGYEHADPHLGNIFLAQTDEGEKIGLIDLGNAKLLSEYKDKQLASKAAQSDIDVASKFIRSLGEESQIAAVDPFAAAENINAKNVLAQLDPFAQAASQRDIRQSASRTFESKVKSDQMLSSKLKPEVEHLGQVSKPLGSRSTSSGEVPKGIRSRTVSQSVPIPSNPPGMGKTEEVAREVASDSQLNKGFNASIPEPSQFPKSVQKSAPSQSISSKQSSVNLPEPNFGSGYDRHRVKRMQRFRKTARDAVGIGHRAAHNAGRKHSKFRSSV
jgi:endonuclease YncB( thermonuclease family)/tRNA A-37 threonylcarbamoyl transferase component Bud32/predicted PolB exonuclease-like 3'-5' exonuclease